MAWKKSSAGAVQRFDKLAAVQGAKRGLLFGCPVYVLDGERYATLYQDRVVLRLSPADATELMSRGGVRSSRSRGGSRRTASFSRKRSPQTHARCGHGSARRSPTRGHSDFMLLQADQVIE